MAFRDHKTLGIVGFVLTGLALLSFALRVTYKVATGHSLDTYYSATFVQWTYGGAFVMLVVGLVAAIVAGVMRLLYRSGRL